MLPSHPPFAVRSRHLAVPCVALALLGGALFNRFPLIFPDSGTYLGIALGPEYAIDRSSVYGLLLKPIVGLSTSVAGLWAALAAQALLVATTLLRTLRRLAPDTDWPWLLLLIPASSLPWHAGQFMPDAFTGPLVLVAWLAARRDPGAPGALGLWLLAVLLALTHYTHIVLLAATAATVLLVDASEDARICLRRGSAAVVALALAAGLLVGANRLVLGRTALSPVGSVFLFARLNEDGLIPAWLDRHCGRDAPVPLCAARSRMPRDSQALLWSARDSVVGTHVWHAAPSERWAWVELMAMANRGAIVERPLAFAGSSARGAVDQFVRFRLLDDECPGNCRSTASGIGYTLARYRPAIVPLLHGSRQGQGTLPVETLRGITTPVAALSLLLLPLLMIAARRRSDAALLSLAAAILVALLANAVLAGALSDVHDRYQSRMIWLAPFALLLAWRRWREPRTQPD